MIDIFLQKDTIKLLAKKNVVFMGDSNIRALYKDMLCLYGNSVFISQKTLKTKMENSCFGDNLLTHGPKCNGRDYKEERESVVKDRKVSFYFITRVYDKYVEEILTRLSCKSNVPDVLIINSCLWDVTRWGPNGVESYKKNLVSLMKKLKRLFPDCLVIWVTAPPIACEVKGGFLVQELQFLKYSLRFHVMEANQFARNIVVNHGFDVVDSHYHLKMQIHRRCDDGIHWQPSAVRYITNLLLTHISLSWNVPLPHRYNSDIMQENLISTTSEDKATSSDSQPKKSFTKISSVIQKPVAPPQNEVTTNGCKIKIEKENFDSPIKPKKSKNKSQRRKKANFQESHHAYLNRVQMNDRHNRIRQWKSMHSSQRNISAFGSPYNSLSNNYHENNYQYDSGYFSSPVYNQALPSPYYSPIESLNAVNSRSTPLLAEPYPFHQYFQTSFRPNLGNTSNTRRVIFSHVPNNQPYLSQNFSEQYFQPIINFASNDDISFGLQF